MINKESISNYKKIYGSSIVGVVINLIILLWLYADFRVSTNTSLPIVFWVILTLEFISIFGLINSKINLNKIKKENPNLFLEVMNDKSEGNVSPSKKAIIILLIIIGLMFIAGFIWIYLAANNII